MTEMGQVIHLAEVRRAFSSEFSVEFSELVRNHPGRHGLVTDEHAIQIISAYLANPDLAGEGNRRPDLGARIIELLAHAEFFWREIDRWTVFYALYKSERRVVIQSIFVRAEVPTPKTPQRDPGPKVYPVTAKGARGRRHQYVKCALHAAAVIGVLLTSGLGGMIIGSWTLEHLQAAALAAPVSFLGPQTGSSFWPSTSTSGIAAWPKARADTVADKAGGTQRAYSYFSYDTTKGAGAAIHIGTLSLPYSSARSEPVTSAASPVPARLAEPTEEELLSAFARELRSLVGRTLEYTKRADASRSERALESREDDSVTILSFKKRSCAELGSASSYKCSFDVSVGAAGKHWHESVTGVFDGARQTLNGWSAVRTTGPKYRNSKKTDKSFPPTPLRVSGNY